MGNTINCCVDIVVQDKASSLRHSDNLSHCKFRIMFSTSEGSTDFVELTFLTEQAIAAGFIYHSVFFSSLLQMPYTSCCRVSHFQTCCGRIQHNAGRRYAGVTHLVIVKQWSSPSSDRL